MILRGVVSFFWGTRVSESKSCASLSSLARATLNILLALCFSNPCVAQNPPFLSRGVPSVRDAALSGVFSGLTASRIAQLGRGQLLGSGLSAVGMGGGAANSLGGMFNGLNGRGLGILAGASGIASGIGPGLGMGGISSLGGFGSGGLGGLGGLAGNQLPSGGFVKPSVTNQITSALRSAHGIPMALPKEAQSEESSKPQPMGELVPNLARNPGAGLGGGLGAVAGGAAGLLGGRGAGGLLGGGGGILSGIGGGMLGGLFAGLNPSRIMQLGVLGGLAGGLGKGLGGAGLGALFSGLNAGGIGQFGRAAGLFSMLGGGGLGAGKGLFSGLSPGRIVMIGAAVGLVSRLKGGGGNSNLNNLDGRPQSSGKPAPANGVIKESAQPQLNIEQF